MRTQTLLLIAGMMLVTYLPRALPAAFLEKIRPGARANAFLEMIPYTGHGGADFPGILSETRSTGTWGCSAAAWRRCWPQKRCRWRCVCWGPWAWCWFATCCCPPDAPACPGNCKSQKEHRTKRLAGCLRPPFCCRAPLP